MLAAAARADKSRCFCCESDFKIVSPASSVSLAVVCARSNVSERVSALETEFTSASLRSSSLSTAKEFLPPPLDSTSKFPRDDFDFSNFCARVCERERETRQLFGRRTKRDAEKTRTSVRANRYTIAWFDDSLSNLKATLFITRRKRRRLSSAVSKTHKEDCHRETKEKEEHNTNTNRYMHVFKKKARVDVPVRSPLLLLAFFCRSVVAREEYLSLVSRPMMTDDLCKVFSSSSKTRRSPFLRKRSPIFFFLGVM